MSYLGPGIIKYNKRKEKSLINFRNKRGDNVGTIIRATTFTTRSLGLPGIDWWQKHVIAHLEYAGKRDPNK